ncbi:MAG: hypothetical protein K2P84_14640 [Undibacterium sp.]|nr:hypothetical protein [Undibacterium sp.]
MKGMRAVASLFLAFFVRFGPRDYLLGVTLVAISLCACAVHFVLQQPQFDVQFFVKDHKIWMNTVDDHTSPLPNQFLEKSNQYLVKFDELPADPQLLMQDPDQLSTFAAYDQFFQQQRVLYQTLSDGQLRVTKANGASEVIKSRTKQLKDIPLAFWLQLVAGSTALLITGVVWSYRKYDVSAIAFLSCGINFAISSCALAVYSLRGLVMDPDLFFILHHINRLSGSVIFYSCIILFWHFPRPLRRFNIIYAIFIIGFFVWLNEVKRWISWPLHDFLMQFVVCIVAALLIAILQWRNTFHNPKERASLRWLLLGISSVMMSAIFLYIIPLMFAPEWGINLGVLNLLCLSAFLGIAFGISRFRLFDLEYWWMEACVWFVGSLIVFTIDIAVISLLQLNVSSSLAFSVVLIAWFYIPGRQWLKRRTDYRRQDEFLQMLPSIIQCLVHENRPEQVETFWNTLLCSVFKPLHFSHAIQTRSQIEIADHGLILAIPSIDATQTILLEACQKGERLFHRNDITLVNAIRDLLQFGLRQKQLKLHIENEERDRIMRDLHDDLGANIISLIHYKDKETTSIARSMLNSLRETIYCLNIEHKHHLSEFLYELRCECQERCELHGVSMNWEVNLPPTIDIRASRQINLKRIVREAFTNIFKHAHANTASLKAYSDGTQLHFQISDKGYLREWHTDSNRGTINMRRRCTELGGEIQFSIADPTGLVISFSFPIEDIYAFRLNS